MAQRLEEVAACCSGSGGVVEMIAQLKQEAKQSLINRCPTQCSPQVGISLEGFPNHVKLVFQTRPSLLG